MADYCFGEPLRLLLVEDYAPMFELLRDDLLEYATFPLEVVGVDSLTLAESWLRQTTDLPRSTDLPYLWERRLENASSQSVYASDFFEASTLSNPRYAMDFILSDLTLPDSQGVATVKRLRKVAVRRPILILTGWDDGELFEQCIAAGADACRVKGRTNGQELIAIIYQLMTTSTLTSTRLATA